MLKKRCILLMIFTALNLFSCHLVFSHPKEIDQITTWREFNEVYNRWNAGGRHRDADERLLQDVLEGYSTPIQFFHENLPWCRNEVDNYCHKNPFSMLGVSLHLKLRSLAN